MTNNRIVSIEQNKKPLLYTSHHKEIFRKLSISTSREEKEKRKRNKKPQESWGEELLAFAS